MLSSVTGGCGSPSMQVRFHALPRAVESPDPNSCRLVSRSPISHIIRLGLSAERGGKRVRADNEEVRVTVLNQTRGLALATADLRCDGEPRELMLEGPAKPGEVLEVTGSFSVSGEQAKFSQTCHID